MGAFDIEGSGLAECRRVRFENSAESRTAKIDFLDASEVGLGRNDMVNTQEELEN